VVARVFRRMFEMKIYDVSKEDPFGFRRGKYIRAAIVLLKISDRTLDINKELCGCFIDWQREFEPAS
jgi:hypothetical protein